MAQGPAPISEVLAAGILMRAGWDDSCVLLDPMCGSGTFLTEAALMAAHVPPGIFRDHFAFERWLDFDQSLLDEVLEEWDEVEPKHKIYGSDINPKAIAIARANIQRAGVQKYIDLNVCPIDDYTLDNRPADTGIVVMNPPYGERMRPESVEGLYGSIGSTLKHAFSGWKAWIISSGQEGFDAVGLKQSVRQELYNGSLPCELRGYELFAGKRDEHLQELSDAGELTPVEERGSFYREQEDFRRSMTGYRKDGRTFDSDREPEETTDSLPSEQGWMTIGSRADRAAMMIGRSVPASSDRVAIGRTRRSKTGGGPSIWIKKSRRKADGFSSYSFFSIDYAMDPETGVTHLSIGVIIYLEGLSVRHPKGARSIGIGHPRNA